jgi:multisubunit Na+/H+ antiporter MnhB subunit
MTQGLDRTRRLLKFYPKAYREERGDEIVATLQEAAEARVPRVALSDQISVAQYGVRVRLGLTSETMFGKALDIAAMPGLVMGAFFGLYLLISGDLPVVSSRFFYPRFGRFLTVGPLIYLVWILAVVVVFEWPQYRRRIAGTCMVLTIIGDFVAKLVHRNPNVWEIAILVSLGVPSLLAPDVYVTRRRILPSLSVGLATFAALFAMTDSHANPGFFTSFYWYGTYEIAHRQPYVDVILLALFAVLWVTKRREVASAALILSSPWIIVGVAYPVSLQNLPVNLLNVIALIAWATGMALIVTTSRYRPRPPVSVEHSALNPGS